MAKDILIGIIKLILNLTFIFGGVASLIISILCFFKPPPLKQLETVEQKGVVNLEDITTKYSKIWKIIYLALAILLFYFSIRMNLYNK